MRDELRIFLNTASNIFYLIGGVLLMLMNPANVFAQLTYIGKALLTTGSTLFHAHEEQWAQRLDEVGMYAAITPIFGYALASVLPFGTMPMIGFTLFLWSFLAMGYYYLDSFVVLPVLVGVPLLIAFIFGNRWLSALSLLLFIVGLWINRDAAETHNHKWTHSIWHLLSEGGLFTLFLAI